jgi:hypothetical protein
VVVLLEHQAVAEQVLVQPAGDPVGEAVVIAQRVPERGAVGAGDHERRGRAGHAGGVDQLVLGDVGEQRVARVAAAGGEPAATGHEQPVIGVADQGHQERRQAVDVVDDVQLLAERLDQPPRRRPAVDRRRRGPELQRVWCRHADRCPVVGGRWSRACGAVGPSSRAAVGPSSCARGRPWRGASWIG